MQKKSLHKSFHAYHFIFSHPFENKDLPSFEKFGEKAQCPVHTNTCFQANQIQKKLNAQPKNILNKFKNCGNFFFVHEVKMPKFQ